MKLKSNPAMVAITTIIIISAISVLVVVFVVLIGVDLLELGLHDTRAEQTFAGSEGCLEEALFSTVTNSSYTGESLTVGSVDCVVVVSGSSTDKTVSISAEHGSGFVADIEAHVNRTTAPPSIIDWDKTAN
ncbi:hypothetical protein KKC94_03315 [Patescibacteria group bacterium]|nr:hypothetical protein [Patescibacteria group bacterium]